MSDADAAVATIRARIPELNIRVGVVLGSGLGGFADTLSEPVSFAYDVLQGFPSAGVGGHAGKLVLGNVGDTPVALLQGRSHYYEEGRADAMNVPIRTLTALGAECLVVTNAAGSLRDDYAPGTIMLLSDHINFAGASPLFGEAGDGRFVDLSEAYDIGLRRTLHDIARDEGIELGEGVYMWFAGPQFETPAEIRAAKVLGADAVGMSTVPEVILARHAGMKVAALSILTNPAAGLSAEKLSHRQTTEVAAQAARSVEILLTEFLRRYGS